MLYAQGLEQVPVKCGEFLAQRTFLDVGLRKGKWLVPKELGRAVTQAVRIVGKHRSQFHPVPIEGAVGFSVNHDNPFIVLEDYPVHTFCLFVDRIGDNLAYRHEIGIRLGVSVGRVCVHRHINHHNAVDFRLEESPSLLRPKIRLVQDLLTIPFPIIPLLGIVELVVECRVSSIKQFRQLHEDTFRDGICRKGTSVVNCREVLILGELTFDEQKELAERKGVHEVKIGVCVHFNPSCCATAFCIASLLLG